MAHGQELVGVPGHDNLAILVQHLEPNLGEADVWTRSQRPFLQARVASAEHISRPHGLQPFDLIHARRAARGCMIENLIGQHAHQNGARVEPRCTQPADDRLLRHFLVEMNELGIVGGGKGDDLLLAQHLVAERHGLAETQVFQVQLVGRRERAMLHGGRVLEGRRWAYGTGRASGQGSLASMTAMRLAGRPHRLASPASARSPASSRPTQEWLPCGSHSRRRSFSGLSYLVAGPGFTGVVGLVGRAALREASAA